MAQVAEQMVAEPEGVRLAESLRRAVAYTEMAEVLRTLGRQSSVPDIRWMAHVAATELADAASFERSGRDRCPASALCTPLIAIDPD